MSQHLQPLFANLRLHTDDCRYRFVHLPANGITAAAAVIAEISTPFSALIADKDEVTIILDQEDLEEYSNRLLGHTVSDMIYRLITLDIVLEPTIIGFLAGISQALAKAEIPVMAVSSYERDHIFVPEDSFDKAVTILQSLQQAR